ncbi:hypothetical protein BKA82DRAFT_35380 [Pisolithus tinctorius]|uniref:F-box domain-containing protein n=1 Tax=Pisolithus tinctorius Marx 270 TaxID=870435 RepID=A0A0C3IAL7_PISTI|nr:hypothetical protein BKA82DRAFT_35380 [Pisolithus tinctorius]KIN94132.1 hypothetical protein M404DRAFT_35380 [Pisolithus tinctorius Marx 270]
MPSIYSLPLELKRHILGYCNIQDIAALAQASAPLNVIARDYIDHRLHVMTAAFFGSTKTLKSILRACDVVISGLCALHILLPANETSWSPSDLDIYVSCRYLACISVLLEHEGYEVVQQQSIDGGPYDSSSIRSVVSFSNTCQCINVIVSTMAAAVSPIFEFHSTAVMNFIMADSVFCAYPALTLRLMSMVNPGPIYFGPWGVKTMQALIKYGARGFRLVPCNDVHGLSAVCRSMPHSIADRDCLWVNTNMMSCVTMSPSDVFYSLGFINLIWLLGGYICGATYPFIRAQCFLIEDDS